MERREQRLDLRVTEEEKANFRLAAEAADRDLSVWIRITLQQAAAEQLGAESDARKDEQ
jgi:uncharacterized protein (DUF1778 family)